MDALLADDKAKHLLPEQIAMELHYWPSSRVCHSAAEVAAFVENLVWKGGYVLVHRHDNPFCDSCTEILLVRVPRSHAEPHAQP